MAKKKHRIKPKTQRVPRTRAGGEWTESGYWQFIRNCFRSSTMRYPPIARQALDLAKRPSQSVINKRLKWEYQCCKCGDWFPRIGVQVDHRVPAGTLKSYDDLPGFVARLFCEADGLDVCCHACHNLKTVSESDGRQKKEVRQQRPTLFE